MLFDRNELHLFAMSTQSAIQKLQDELQRRFRVAGRGSVTRVQEALQLGGGYFRDLRRPERQRLDLRVLLGALEVLRVDTAEFFASVFGPSDVVGSFLADAAEMSRKMRRPPQILRQLEKRLASPPASCTRLASEALEELDNLRRDDPKQAMRACRQAVAKAEAPQIPRLLGSYASACRVAGRLSEAQVVMAEALKMADERTNPRGRAELIQRAAYILADQGHHEQALRLVDAATLIYARSGDTVGIGQTLLDLGTFNGALERFEDAFNYFQRAAELIPEDSTGALAISRVSAQFNLAVAGLYLGRLEEAEHYAQLARKLIACQGQAAQGKVIWLEASIAKAQGRNEDVVTLLGQALEIFQDFEPLTAALIAVELVQWQLAIGRTVEAYAAAKAMISLLKPLEGNRIASAAITDLARSALAGQSLTSALLDQVTADLKNSRSSKSAKKR